MTATIEITDADDSRLADYRLLNNQSARRDIEGDEFFIAEGYVVFDQLIASHHDVRSVLLASSRVQRFGARVADLARLGAPVYVVDRDVMTAVVGYDAHRGVFAAATRRVFQTVEEVAATARRVAMLEGLNDAENLGAIARAARALSIDALVIDAAVTDPYTRRTVRVSMGEVLSLPIARVDANHWLGAFDTLHDRGFETWAMTPAADASNLWNTPVPERLAVVLGAEGPGLDSDTIAAATRRVRIPISDTVDSLNVGHAAAITFAAITRPSP